MNVHEYQAKEIFRKYGVPTPRGGVAFSGPEARKVAEELGGDLWVVKAQIHAGGRGKAGGVKLARSLNEVEKIAEEMLGMTLVTHQTGPEGKVVKKVYIEEGADIKAEFYLGMVLDRALEMPVMMASTEGGMEIEEVAAKTPEKIIKVAIDPTIGFQPFYARKLAFGLGLSKEEQKEFIKFVKSQPHPFKLLLNDVMSHYPLGKIFYLEKEDVERFFKKDIVPTGLLPGKKAIRAKGIAREIEEKYDELIPAKGDRRMAWIYPEFLEKNYLKEKAWFEMSFILPKGAYATVLIDILKNGVR